MVQDSLKIGIILCAHMHVYWDVLTSDSVSIETVPNGKIGTQKAQNTMHLYDSLSWSNLDQTFAKTGALLIKNCTTTKI